MFTRNFSFFVSLESTIKDIVSRSDFPWLSYRWILKLWPSQSSLQVILQPIAFSFRDTNCYASSPDARFPIASSTSSGHRMQLPWHFPAHGYLISFHDDLIPREPLVRTIPFSTSVDNLSRGVLLAQIFLTHKTHDCPRFGRGKPIIRQHLLAVWLNLLQFVHLTVFPPAPNFSMTERTASSSSRAIPTACDSKIDSPLLRTTICIRSLFNHWTKQAFPKWKISPTAPMISSGLQILLAASLSSVCISSIRLPQEATLLLSLVEH